MAYKYHIDPGHGWIEVPYAEIVALGIQDEISEFSYRDGDTCFLEEDCDAYLWQHSHNGRYGVDPEVVIVQHDDIEAECFIRCLDRYWMGEIV